MKKIPLVLTAAALTAAAVVFAPAAGASPTTSVLDFESTSPGNVSSVMTSDGQTIVPVYAYDSGGATSALVANVLGGRSLGASTTGDCDRVHLILGAACPAGAVRLVSLRLVGTTDHVKIVLFDRGGNVGPNGVGQIVPATGANGSQVIEFPVGSTGLADDAVAELMVVFHDGNGFIDDVTFECPCECDCGGGDPTPGIELTKSATPNPVGPGQPVTYTYVVRNTGTTTLTNVVVNDDNGTPGNTGDDFEAGSVATLAPGATVTFSRTLVPLPGGSGEMCMDIDGTDTTVGSLSATILPSGDVEVTYVQDLDVVDNTYGTNSSSGWGSKGHTFSNLLGSDKAQFRFRDGSGNNVLEFYADCISASSSAPSGYATLGVSGGDGKMVLGSAANVLSVRTSISDSLNQSPAFYGYTTNSPAGSDFPGWAYENSYTVVVSRNAFGAAGYGGVEIVGVHNSPSKLGFNLVEPKPCDDEVTNIATATATSDGGLTVTASDSATVTIVGPDTTSTDGKKPKDPKEPKAPKPPKDPKDPKSKKKGKGKRR